MCVCVRVCDRGLEGNETLNERGPEVGVVVWVRDEVRLPAAGDLPLKKSCLALFSRCFARGVYHSFFIYFFYIFKFFTIRGGDDSFWAKLRPRKKRAAMPAWDYSK